MSNLATLTCPVSTARGKQVGHLSSNVTDSDACRGFVTCESAHGTTVAALWLAHTNGIELPGRRPAIPLASRLGVGEADPVAAPLAGTGPTPNSPRHHRSPRAPSLVPPELKLILPTNHSNVIHHAQTNPAAPPGRAVPQRPGALQPPSLRLGRRRQRQPAATTGRTAGRATFGPGAGGCGWREGRRGQDPGCAEGG